MQDVALDCNRGQEPSSLGIGIVANLASEVATRQKGGVKRPGSKHFVPGAKLWVGPVNSGDGFERVEVIGIKRGTRGSSLIRLMQSTMRLSRFRVAPVYQPAVMKKIKEGRWWDEDFRAESEVSPNAGDNLRSYLIDFAQSRTSWVTQHSHFGVWGHGPSWWLPPGQLHWIDERCAFCAGLDAGNQGNTITDNPYDNVEVSPEYADDYMHLVSDYHAWQIGWHVALRSVERNPTISHGWHGDPKSTHALGLVDEAIGLIYHRLKTTTELTGRYLKQSPILGMEIDLATTLLSRMMIRCRIVFGDDDQINMTGRVTVRLDENDKISEIRAG